MFHYTLRWHPICSLINVRNSLTASHQMRSRHLISSTKCAPNQDANSIRKIGWYENSVGELSMCSKTPPWVIKRRDDLELWSAYVQGSHHLCPLNLHDLPYNKNMSASNGRRTSYKLQLNDIGKIFAHLMPWQQTLHYKIYCNDQPEMCNALTIHLAIKRH